MEFECIQEACELSTIDTRHIYAELLFRRRKVLYAFRDPKISNIVRGCNLMGPSSTNTTEILPWLGAGMAGEESTQILSCLTVFCGVTTLNTAAK